MAQTSFVILFCLTQVVAPSSPTAVYEESAHDPMAGVTLPEMSADATSAQRQFDAVARRAVRRVFEDDGDDPAVVLSLLGKLDEDPALAAAAAWRTPLTAALARTTTLQAIGPTLRALQRAMAEAYFDAQSRTCEHVNVSGCKQAMAGTALAHNGDLLVTIEPVGTHALKQFATWCRVAMGL